jgi:hypothetical protein
LARVIIGGFFYYRVFHWIHREGDVSLFIPYEFANKSDLETKSFAECTSLNLDLAASFTEPISCEMLAIGGMFRGIGRYRPANRGTNGRFEIAEFIWREDRRLAT